MKKFISILMLMLTLFIVVPTNNIAHAKENKNIVFFEYKYETGINSLGTTFGIMDSSGNILLPAEYMYIQALQEYSEYIRYSLQMIDFGSESATDQIFSRKTAMADENGKILTDFIYSYINEIDKNLYVAHFYDYSKTHILNEKGEILYEIEGMASVSSSEKIITVVVDDLNRTFLDKNFKVVGDDAFYEKYQIDIASYSNTEVLFPITDRKTLKQGMVDSELNIVLAPTYDSIFPAPINGHFDPEVSTQMYIVSQGGKYGALNANCELVIPVEYMSISFNVNIKCDKKDGNADIYDYNYNKLDINANTNYYTTYESYNNSGLTTLDILKEDQRSTLYYSDGTITTINTPYHVVANYAKKYVIAVEPEKEVCHLLDTNTGEILLTASNIMLESKYILTDTYFTHYSILENYPVEFQSYVVDIDVYDSDLNLKYEGLNQFYPLSHVQQNDTAQTIIFGTQKYNTRLYGTMDDELNIIIPAQYQMLNWYYVMNDFFLFNSGLIGGVLDSDGTVLYQTKVLVLDE